MNLITKIKDELNNREANGDMVDAGFVFPFGGEHDTPQTGRTSPQPNAPRTQPPAQRPPHPTHLKGRDLGDFVAGVFLAVARGRIAVGGNRKDAGYNIEFVFEDIDNARAFCQVLSQYEIFPKMTVAKGVATVRAQSVDCICNFLALVGAKNCLMEINNEIALRDLRNTANRRANCDTGNIEKQVSASNSQITIIKDKIENGEITKLSAKLRATATARMENPNATYEELAKILGITKSGLVHRLRQITNCFSL
jgi:DNA-binding protein WhiA